MNDSNTDQPKKQMQWIESADGVFEVYANLMHITWSVDDVRIRLAQMVNSPETPNPGEGFQGVAQERAAVTFSWRGAKILRDELISAIENFEATNGPINVDIRLPGSVVIENKPTNPK
jgi:hypothetical protein